MLPPMRAMIIRIPIQTAAAAGVRHVAVSLPRIDCLLADQPGKYLLPENLPPPSKVDSQPIGRRRLYRPISARCRRAAFLPPDQAASCGGHLIGIKQ